ncbi:hypothetical protein ACOJUR_10900 [Alicyclobacillus tolerans]
MLGLKYIHYILAIILILSLSGCTPSAQINHKTNDSPHPTIFIKSSTGYNIPSTIKNPIQAAEAAMTWKLSDGEIVHANNKNIINDINIGDLSIVRIQIPKIYPQNIDYILILEYTNQKWILRGVLGTILQNPAPNNELANPYANMMYSLANAYKVGHFAEFYTPKILINIAQVPLNFVNLPIGQKYQLKSGQIVHVFSQSNETILYFNYGGQWLIFASQMNKKQLIAFANSIKIYRYFN